MLQGNLIFSLGKPRLYVAQTGITCTAVGIKFTDYTD